MASRLLSIPAELLASIADELNAADYGSLRLCCKQAERFTFSYFAKKFFNSRKFFRGHLSLSTLLAISESRLGPYLETVILSTVFLEDEPPSGSDTVLKAAYVQAHADQTSILATGWDRDMLAAAFEKLPNLKGIASEAFDDGEIFDYELDQYNSENDGGYGLKSMLRDLHFEPGRPPRQRGLGDQWVVTAQTLLAAAAKANVRPKVLCLGGRNEDGTYYIPETVGVDDAAFNIPPFMRQLLLPVIEGLEELDLHVRNRFIYQLQGDTSYCRTGHLRKFLGIPTRLQTLRIHRLLGGDVALPPLDHGDDFWAWMGQDHKGKGKETAGPQGAAHGSGSSGPDATVPPPPISFPHLRELELGTQDIRLDDLTRLLTKVSPTLRKLSLQDIVLRDRRGEPQEDYDDVVKAEAELWASLCGRLAALPCAELREVSIGGLGDVGPWHMREFGDLSSLPGSVCFKVLRIAGENTYSGRAEFSYKGPDARGALRQLADDLRAALKDGRHVFSAEPVRRRCSF